MDEAVASWLSSILGTLNTMGRLAQNLILNNRHQYLHQALGHNGTKLVAPFQTNSIKPIYLPVNNTMTSHLFTANSLDSLCAVGNK